MTRPCSPARTITLTALALAAALSLAPGPARAAADTYNIDPDHSTIGFKVSHLAVSRVNGRFDKFEGTLAIDPADLTRTVANVAIDAASIDTNEPNRDKHLRSGDFFEVEKFPKLTFQSKAVRKVGDGYEMDGDLTIRGVTKPVTLKVEVIGLGPDPRGGHRAGFEAKGKINRKDFGVSWNNVLDGGSLVVGEMVDLDLSVEAFHPAAATK